MSVDEHRAEAPEQVRFAVLTVSDTRTKETDESGSLIIEMVTGAFHVAAVRALCKDDPPAVQALVKQATTQEGVDCLVITGGTGIARRDSTYEAVRELYELEIPGFGELFRSLSYEDIGSAAILSRAVAGLKQGKVVFVIPGSRGAVRLAMEKLIIPELGHLAGEAIKTR